MAFNHVTKKPTLFVMSGGCRFRTVQRKNLGDYKFQERASLKQL